MSFFVRRGALALIVVALLCVGVSDAAGPGTTAIKKSSSPKITITTTTLTAPLYLGDEVNEIPAGTATYCTVTITTCGLYGTSTKTCSTFTVQAYGLDAEDGTVVSFEPFEDSEQLFGSATINCGKLCASLSTKRGDVIPVFEEGDDIEIEEAYATGVFGAPKICTTCIGK